MNNHCIDVGYYSLNKHSEQICGDHIEVINQDENSMVMVLADGLGSGVKANILSTLTSKIISTMMANKMTIEECVETIASTLPVCNIRGIAYSTFTIIKIINLNEAEIIQYDNPHVIMLRNGLNYEYDKSVSKINGKKIYRSKIKLKLNDIFILFSDGAIYAGVGRNYNFGWNRENIIKYIEELYKEDYSAKVISTIIIDECDRLYGMNPGDDTTVGAIKIRKRKPVNLLIGPPNNPKDLRKMLSLFFSKEGKHIVCGGTISNLVSEFLKSPLLASTDYVDHEIPPIAIIDGVDLVTEGVITINRVLLYAKNYLQNNELYYDWSVKNDGASLISKLLFQESTDINFYVGCAINPAHQNPQLPINFSIKMRLVDELADCLREMGKIIKVSYF